MWERYHFYGALELEQWKGTYVGCVVIPKKYLRYYDPRYAAHIIWRFSCCWVDCLLELLVKAIDLSYCR